MPRTLSSHRPAARLDVERLEDREVPAVIYAVTNSRRLVTFDSATPNVLIRSAAITGLNRADERITDIDVRSGNGVIYGRGDTGRLYTINDVTGFATLVGGTVLLAAPPAIDFDPTTDRLRVVNNASENFTINPNDGTLASVGARASYLSTDPAFGLTPRIGALGFTNSAPFALQTQLYGIDPARDTLVRAVGSPDAGVYATVGVLGLDTTSNVGFDISSFGNAAFATFQPTGSKSSVFAQVNLSTGLARVVGTVGPTAPLVLDMAVSRTLATTGTVFPPSVPNFSLVPTSLAAVTVPVSNAGLTTVLPAVAAGVSPPTTVPTTPLFTTLVQPLAPGTVGGSILSNTPFGTGITSLSIF